MTEIKNFGTTLEKIQARGYWRVEIYPTSYTDELVDVMSIPELIRKTVVQFRGWDYPHKIDHRMENRFDFYAIDGNRYEAWIDWTDHKEVWRFYDSGKFTHLFSLNEQWADDYDESWGPKPWSNREDLKYGVDAPGVIFKLTEIFEFIARLGRALDLDDVHVKIQIHNVENNKLVVIDPRRADLWDEYVNRSKVITAINAPLNMQELSEQRKRLETSAKAIQKTFSFFSWKAPDGLISVEQDKLLNGRL